MTAVYDVTEEMCEILMRGWKKGLPRTVPELQLEVIAPWKWLERP